jgi:hypothetical protein
MSFRFAAGCAGAGRRGARDDADAPRAPVDDDDADEEDDAPAEESGPGPGPGPGAGAKAWAGAGGRAAGWSRRIVGSAGAVASAAKGRGAGADPGSPCADPWDCGWPPVVGGARDAGATSDAAVAESAEGAPRGNAPIMRPVDAVTVAEASGSGATPPPRLPARADCAFSDDNADDVCAGACGATERELHCLRALKLGGRGPTLGGLHCVRKGIRRAADGGMHGKRANKQVETAGVWCVSQPRDSSPSRAATHTAEAPAPEGATAGWGALRAPVLTFRCGVERGRYGLRRECGRRRMGRRRREGRRLSGCQSEE